jgi:4-amino-4-deoxy-L-arabinose transferase-like glycosyltransferase
MDSGSPRAFALRSSRASRVGILVGVLLVAALLIRLDGITTPSIESRELHNPLIARQLYYGDGAGLPAWKQQVLRELGEVVRPIEPPVLDLIAAAGFRLAGGEELWIPRLVSSLLWILGGVFLYLIAVRLTTRPGALVALALYLLWPYGAFISRLYMPDAMMISLLLAGALTVIRYWERPSSRRLLAAGIVSGAATAAKPGVAIVFLLALFVVLAVSRRALVETVTRARLPLFAVLAALPTGLYYVYGAYLRDFLSGQSEGRIDLSLLATECFWRGWWEMVSIVLPFPQRQAYLALVPLAAGLAGVLVARAGLPRATLVGLGVGYVAFAFTFLPRRQPSLLLAPPHPDPRPLDRQLRRFPGRAARATASGSCHPARVFRTRRRRRCLQGARGRHSAGARATDRPVPTDRQGHAAHDAGALRRRASQEPDLVLGLDGRALLVPAHAVAGFTPLR